MSIKTLINAQKTHLTQCMPGDFLDEAVAAMVNAGRNAAIVIDGKKELQGIITDHDIMRAVHHCNLKASALEKEVVSNWMTAHVISCDINDSLTTALNIMGKHKIRHLIAMENQQPIAVISLRDVLFKMHQDDLLEINVLRDLARASHINTSTAA